MGSSEVRGTPAPKERRQQAAIGRRGLLGGALAAVAVVGVGGFALSRGDEGDKKGSGAAGSGVVTVACAAATLGLDPDSSVANPSMTVWGLAYDTLVDGSTPSSLSDASGSMTPDYIPPGLMAQSWTSEDEGRRWLFTIREGALSGAGNTLTSEDVVWSLHRVLGVGGIASFFFALAGVSNVDQVKALDAKTVELSFRTPPPPYFLKVLGVPWLAIYDSVEIKKNATAEDPWGTEWLTKNTAGFGPFKLGTLDPNGSRCKMVRNPGYWDKPAADAVREQVFQFVPEDSSRLQLLLSGSAQVAETLTALQLGKVDKAKETKVVEVATGANVFLGMNCEMAPFNDPEVRRAVARAVPYDDIIKNVYHGQAERWKTVLPPWFEAATDEFWDYDTDLEAAKKVLSGVTETIKLTYTAEARTEEEICILVAQSLNSAGLKVELDGLPRATSSERRRNGELQFFIDPWDAPGVPSSFYAIKQLYTTEPVQDLLHYTNPAVDAAYEEGIAATDAAGTEAALVKAQKIIAADMPMIPLVWTGSRIGAAANINGFQSITTSTMWLRGLTYTT